MSILNWIRDHLASEAEAEGGVSGHDVSLVTEIDADQLDAARRDPAVLDLHRRADNYAAQYDGQFV